MLIIGDPGRIDRQRRWLRVTTLLMTGLITLVTAVSAVRLVVGILTNATFSTASQLLIALGDGQVARVRVRGIDARREGGRQAGNAEVDTDSAGNTLRCSAPREFSSGCLSEN